MMRPSPSIAHPLLAVLVLVGCRPWFGGMELKADDTSPVRLATANEPLPPDGSFQVAIEVFAVIEGEENQLQDRHLVLFHNGKAYDFALTEPRVVTVIDPIREEVTLLSRENHVKSRIPNQTIINTTAQFRLFVKQQGLGDRVGINANIEKIAGEPNLYRTSFADFHYDATAVVPELAMQPDRFAEFTDWVARVNLIRKLGTPPFARIKLGRTIATDGLVPSTITLQVRSETQQRTFLSNYTFKNGLSREAEKRLDEVAGMMTLYREIPLPAFPK